MASKRVQINEVRKYTQGLDRKINNMDEKFSMEMEIMKK
jgi:hypothetical protein